MSDPVWGTYDASRGFQTILRVRSWDGREDRGGRIAQTNGCAQVRRLGCRGKLEGKWKVDEGNRTGKRRELGRVKGRVGQNDELYPPCLAFYPRRYTCTYSIPKGEGWRP